MTDDGARVWVEMDGVAVHRPEDDARIFVTACRFQADRQPHTWVDTIVGVLEGVLDTARGTAHARLFECRQTIA